MVRGTDQTPPSLHDILNKVQCRGSVGVGVSGVHREVSGFLTPGAPIRAAVPRSPLQKSVSKGVVSAAKLPLTLPGHPLPRLPEKASPLRPRWASVSQWVGVQVAGLSPPPAVHKGTLGELWSFSSEPVPPHACPSAQVPAVSGLSAADQGRGQLTFLSSFPSPAPPPGQGSGRQGPKGWELGSPVQASGPFHAVLGVHREFVLRVPHDSEGQQGICC